MSQRALGNQFRFLHFTDAELKPGDTVQPAAAIGHESMHEDVPGYDPHRVYLHDTHDPAHDIREARNFGEHGYAVEPIGEVGPDPEVEHTKARYTADPASYRYDYGLSDKAPVTFDELGSALAARTAKAARVLRKVY